MTEPVIDAVVFDEIAELMGDALGSFIETYIDNSPKLLEGMSIALPTGDIETVINNAHQLKGGSGSIGAMSVFQYAKQLEEDARAGSLDNLENVLAQLKLAYDLVEIELKTHLN
jgi:HPt (histidine-containing phosphotransfer) domain-containing protein